MNERTTRLKERAISEAKKFAVIVAYLWVLFTLFQLVGLTILRKQNPAITFDYRVGFSFINALIVGKIILIAEAFHLGERFKDTLLVYAILFKSAVFSALLVCCDILEDVLAGVFHNKAITQALPPLDGSGMERILLVGLITFIVLIPFFAFREVARVIGEDELYTIIFKRTHLNSG